MSEENYWQFQRIDRLQAEIERLTAALAEIRDYPEWEDGRLDSMEAIAREALQEVSDE